MGGLPKLPGIRSSTPFLCIAGAFDVMLMLCLQEDCGGVSIGLWYDLINSLAMGAACLTPDMERQVVVQGIRGCVQHQSRLSQAIVSPPHLFLTETDLYRKKKVGIERLINRKIIILTL